VFEGSGARLAEVRRRLTEPGGSIPILRTYDHDDVTEVPDEAIASTEYECRADDNLLIRYYHELDHLMTLAPDRANRPRYHTLPLSLQFGFLLAALSRPALELARHFIPLSSYTTIRTTFQNHIERVRADLSDIRLANDQGRIFKETMGLPDASLIAISVDAIALDAGIAFLPSAGSMGVFVFSAQPLDRCFKCFPLHVRTYSSARPIAPIQAAMTVVSSALAERGLIAKYLRADGDSCHRQRHADFFFNWYPVLIGSGMKAPIDHISEHNEIQVRYFLHI
jgi:hypothetical protein